MQVSSSIPWQLLGMVGGKNKSVLVLEPVESQGGRMVAWKRGTSTCHLIATPLKLRQRVATSLVQDSWARGL